MAHSVYISDRAVRNLEDILNYLEDKWSVRIKLKYLNILESKVKAISENPYLYQDSGNKKGVHRCVVTKQSIMYYRILDYQIEIITIQDSRRDLSKLKF